jgi:pilus assembly protein CpaF
MTLLERQRAAQLARENAAGGAAAPALPSPPPAVVTPSPEATAEVGGLQRAALIQKRALLSLQRQVKAALIAQAAPIPEEERPAMVRGEVAKLIQEIAPTIPVILGRAERRAMEEKIVTDVLGLGPLEALLADHSITEILVNGPDTVFVERYGVMSRVQTSFESPAHLMQVIERIVGPLGRRVDESSPMVDARLPDGSRVNVVVPPLTIHGASLTIRRMREDPLGVSEMVDNGTASQEMIDFLAHCVRARVNMVVSGGGSAGKTTTLNALSGFIAPGERIITIEDAAELQLNQRQVIRLESRPANAEGKGLVTIRDLLINALRMRPDRIVIGECRGGEALDMLQAMNTGHDGSMTCVHASSPAQALSRIETMVLMAGHELPSRAIREQIGAAIHVVVHQQRLRDGSRRILEICEVLGFEGTQVHIAPIFRFEQSRIGEGGQVIGEFRRVGGLPRIAERLQAAGEAVEGWE